MSDYKNERITIAGKAEIGTVSWSKEKFFWLVPIYLIALIGGTVSFTLDAFLLFVFFTAFTLCFGHSLGMHRLFIHKSYKTYKPIEYFFVHLGVLVGLAGPIGMIKTHDTRDWAQRQKVCHDYFGHKQVFWKDAIWQLFCDVKLHQDPVFEIEIEIVDDPVYQWMEKYWMWQQVPWAILFYLLGGFSWVIWGIFVRIAVSVTGHWLIGYFAHNHGHRDWHIEGADVQGFNVKFMSLLTMGESWHNNHHAFPGSANLGIEDGQLDPGWQVLKALKKVGLVWDIKTHIDLAPRQELKPINPQI